MAVDLLGGRLVLGLELRLNVGSRLAVLLGSCSKKGAIRKMVLVTNRGTLTRVVGEADGQWRLADLFLKQILLVQEEDDRSVREPLVVAD